LWLIVLSDNRKGAAKVWE